MAARLALPHAVLALLISPLGAQPLNAAGPAPYAIVAVTPPAAFTDTSFEAFRKELAAVAKARVYAGLERLVLRIGFFWDRDFGGRFDAGKPAAENLAAALRLEHGAGDGWKALADFAAEPSAAAAVARPGVYCAPAEPAFDAVEFHRLVDATYTGASDWVYPRTDGVEVREAPLPNGKVIDKLGLNWARSLDQVKAGAQRTSWIQLVTPSGKTGFAPPGSLALLQGERLCYRKDALGHWRIAGFVGAQE